MSAGVTIRERRPTDVPGLVEMLTLQQPTSGYPMRWPLPFPAEQFVVRPAEERAWVAERDDGAGPVLLGHVAVSRVEGEGLAEFRAAGVEGRLAAVSVLLVDPACRGHGIGGRLLEHAVAAIRADGRRPVLDVAPVHAAALALYRRRGWQEVRRIRPPWLPAHQPDVWLMVLPD
ncbi:GNAT family N-acetyltransferase [Nocardioides ferulae]|uniref:GNAT family N-acetyltransferase n=1 Tax=Nocardioides ferulae TaxID=2340821 RepID=UPI00197D8908|nr:N-acetyltransferase [Nocardioides ferulae]